MNTTPTATLFALHTDIKPGTILLDANTYTVGRSCTCDVTVDDPQQKLVSRLHARIEAKGPRYLLYDEQSANGTFVNGQRVITPHLLTDQDAIGLGSLKPLFRYQDVDRTSVNESRLHYDDRLLRFKLDGNHVNLTPGQLRLLQLLFINAGSTCTRAACWEAKNRTTYDYDSDTNALDRAVSQLRGRLYEASPDIDNIIVLERGVGYRLEL